MISVNGTMEIDEAGQEMLLPLIRDAMTATHQEEGCLIYRFMRDITSPTTFHIAELWASEAALRAHMQAPPFLTVVPLLYQHARIISLTALHGELEPFDLGLPQ